MSDFFSKDTYSDNLMIVELPVGDFIGFNIMEASKAVSTGTKVPTYDPHLWLDKGFDGVRLIGAGRDKTHIRPMKGDAFQWGPTLNIHPEAGHVVLENLSLHAGSSSAAYVGRWKQEDIVPLVFELNHVALVADEPETPQRSQWGVFSYQADLRFIDVVVDCEQLSEHACYAHGFSKYGAFVHKYDVVGCGATPFKVRSDPEEIAPVLGTRIVIQESKFQNWNQPWSNRGGNGIELQGTGSDIAISSCEFLGGSGKSKMGCLKVDDNAGKGFWGAVDGKFKSIYANGHILITGSLFTGDGPSWYEKLIDIAPDSGDDIWVAQSVNFDHCGLYGPGTLVQVQAVDNPQIYVSGCNKDSIAAALIDVGVDVSSEALFTSNGGPTAPFSSL